MLSKFRDRLSARLISALVVIAAVAGLGSYLLAGTHALSPPAPIPPKPSLLKPYSLGTAPYQYIAYSGSLADTQAATGIKQYFAAFVVSGPQACSPSWGGGEATGLGSSRSAAIAADFTKLRAAGGEAAVSFGGASGSELAVTCTSPTETAAAYKNVIDTYNLKRVDFDIEGNALMDAAANDRRAAAIATLQHASPDLKVWVTLPVTARGLTPQGSAVIRQMTNRGVVLSGINIMAMNYNIGSKDMGRQATLAAQAADRQLQTLFPTSAPADIWKGMGITVMAGRNNTVPETFTLADAPRVRTFAVDKGVGMLSLWNAGRDRACPDGGTGTADAGPSISCSGVAQQPYDFLKALTIPALP